MKRKLFLTCVALLLINAITFAQQRTVTGKVTDSEGIALTGATISVKGLTIGTIGDIDGNYSLSFEGDENSVLMYSFIGYITEEVTVGNQQEINMTLIEDISDLDEIVVVGYGVQKKSLVTGAISQISSDELVAEQPQRVEQAIQGKVSGVAVTSNSGSPGGGLTMRIRGTSSNGNSDPLYIVDGMRTGGIDYLDPADIESIEILKDAASSAIYGAEGGNGVVLISTKKGKKGQAQVTYSGYYGVQTYMNRFETMDQNQFVDYYQRAVTIEQQNNGVNKGWDQEKIDGNIADKFTELSLPNIGETLDPQYDNNTNWLEELTSPAPITSHNIGISGGSEKSTYSGSVNYFNQDGVLGGDRANFKRYTARLNMDHQANDWLKVGIKATYSHRERKSLDENNVYGGTYMNAMTLDPLTPVTHADTNHVAEPYLNNGYGNIMVKTGDGDEIYGMSVHTMNEIKNPFAQIYNSNGTWQEDKVLAGAFAELELLKGLKFRSSYDIDVANSLNEWYTPQYFYHAEDINEISQSAQQTEKWNTWFFDNVLSYENSFGEHSFSAMVGSHAEESKHNRLEAYGRDLIREDYAFSHPANAQNIASSEDYIVSGTTENGDKYKDTVTVDIPVAANDMIGGWRNDPTRLASIFGRFTYNYGEKYMVNFTLRNDRSSKLSPKENPKTGRNYQSGLFPSISGGWVMSKENFWGVPFINFLKLRYSYGENGSLGNISAFQYVPLIGFSGYPYSDANGGRLEGALPTVLSNDALQWETTAMHNIGVDFRLFNSKFSGSLEYFKKITNDLLTTQPIPTYVGNTAPDANIGTVENTGVEIELSYKDYEGEFQWELGGNVTFMDNEVTYFPGGQNGAGVGVGGLLTRIDEGMPMWYFNGYKTDGVWNSWDEINAENTYENENGKLIHIQSNAQPGDVRIINQNGDSIINADDKAMIGSPYADVLLGLNFNANYKGFDFSTQLTASIGNDVYFGAYRSDVGTSNKPLYFYEDGWTPETQSQDFFRPTETSNWNYEHHDMFVEDGSYLKLRNVQIGYTLKKEWTEAIQISRVRFYVSGNNLFILSKYHGSDPELGGNQNAMGIDQGYYAAPRTFLGGLQVTF